MGNIFSFIKENNLTLKNIILLEATPGYFQVKFNIEGVNNFFIITIYRTKENYFIVSCGNTYATCNSKQEVIDFINEQND